MFSIYSDRSFLASPSTRHADILVPFWGTVPDAPPDTGRFDRYAEVGSSFLRLTSLPDCDVGVFPQNWETAGERAVELGQRFAAVCHEANRMYTVALGEVPKQPIWADAPEWQVMSAINGVAAILEGRVLTPRQSHENWLAEKEAAGWVWGPVKDPAKKQHPCCVPYDDLPVAQRRKDALFGAIVHALGD